MIKTTKTRVIVSISKETNQLLEHETDRVKKTKSEIIEAALDYYLHEKCGWLRKDDKIWL